ncbi:MAG: hypothetical protein ACFHWX_04725 [Bacteroidota bacterium]
MEQTTSLDSRALKWREVYSLAALNVAVVISWIAYHEYQPHLVETFNLGNLTDFLIITKAIVLIVIPPLAGLLADRIMKKSGKFFIVFTVGIGATAMIFMIVATIIGAGPLSSIQPALPIMIILWLVSMNLFISPANSMIEAFAPVQKLPVVMGFLILTTELVYALEPLVVELVRFFGDTLTFVVGGVLISGTGFLFHKVSSDEVLTRKKELLTLPSKSLSIGGFITIIIIGLQLGLGKGLLVEFLPGNIASNFTEYADIANYISFGLLGLAAFVAFFAGFIIQHLKLERVLIVAFIIQFVGILIIIVSSSFYQTLAGAIITAGAFSFINVSGLPYALKHLSVKHITYGVGIYIGSSEVVGGILEYFLR